MKNMLVACLAAGLACASTTTTWEMNSWTDFVRGRFDGVALDRDGRLSPAPAMVPVLQPGQAAVWSVARADDGSVYAGTGNRGKLFRIGPDGKSLPIWTADQPEIFAVAIHNGDVYAGTSPDGAVWRVSPAGKATEFFHPKAKYIWSLAVAPDGTLYVGTGAPANVYRVDTAGHAELWYESGQGHVTAMAVDHQGRLIAGTEPNGVVYRIAAKGKAFVLYDANLPEIRSISVAPDGAVYAAAMGGSLAGRSAAQMPVSMSPMSVTVTATSTSVTTTDAPSDTPTQGGSEIKPSATAKPAAAPQAVTAVMPSTPAVDVSGVEKSALFRINPDNTVETIWSSKEENIYDVLARGNDDLLITTDAQGRIYHLGANRRAALIAQTGEGEATRLLQDGSALLAATAETGGVFELGKQTREAGYYESPVHDSGSIARWGTMTWHLEGAGTVQIESRTGNSARPDNTWSDWQTVTGTGAGAAIRSPNARYIQWRAALTGSAILDNVLVPYLPQNSPPVVRSISVTTQAAPGSTQKASSASASQNAAYTVTVTDTGGDSSSQTSAGTPTQTLGRSNSQIQISWQADDPENDHLVYSLWFRGDGEDKWKLIRSNMNENTLLLDNDVLADGRYFFRVIASDRPSNPPEAARETELVSSPVLIDNTPPVVTIRNAVRHGSVAELDVDAHDGESALRRCEYSLDAAPWLPVEAVDGLTDSPQEQFHIEVQHLSPGEHLIVVRVYDSAGNAGLTKYVAHAE